MVSKSFPPSASKGRLKGRNGICNCLRIGSTRRLSERLTFSVCSFFSLLPNRYISVLRDCRFGVLRCCYLLSSCFA